MIRNIVTNTDFLAKKSTLATKEDAQIIQDLKDTLAASLTEARAL